MERFVVATSLAVASDCPLPLRRVERAGIVRQLAAGS